MTTPDHKKWAFYILGGLLCVLGVLICSPFLAPNHTADGDWPHPGQRGDEHG